MRVGEHNIKKDLKNMQRGCAWDSFNLNYEKGRGRASHLTNFRIPLKIGKKKIFTSPSDYKFLDKQFTFSSYEVIMRTVRFSECYCTFRFNLKSIACHLRRMKELQSEQCTQLEYEFTIYFFKLRRSITFHICATTKHHLLETRNHNYYAYVLLDGLRGGAVG